MQKASAPTLLERLDINVPLRLLGFGLIYAWGICLWDIPLSASGTASALQTHPAWLLSAMLTPASCVAVAIWGRRRELSRCPWLYAGAPLLCTAGTVALIACGYTEGTARDLCALAAGVGTGCGPAFLVVLWGCLFARIETSVTETVIPASFVATMLCALVIPTLPPLAAGAVVALLPLASGFLLALSRTGLSRNRIPAEDAANFKPLAATPFTVARMMIAVFVLYTLGCAAPAASPVTMSVTSEAWATVVGMLFAVTLSAGIVLFAHRVNVASLYRWITVPFVVGIVATPLNDELAAFLARVLMNAVFTGIEIITMLYFIRLSQRTRPSATFYVGLGAGAAYGGVLAGYGMTSMLQDGIRNPESALFFCLVLLGAFALTSLLVPRQDATLEESAVGGTEPAASEGGAGSEGAADAVMASYAEKVDVVLAHRTSVAAEHGLSARETEIFLLLAQGRSRPYIRDSLYLSKNTVATHIRHIYEKLGIHSQQELIDLVEE
ncbi:LuxR C-terminal-related transcriptional regulator [Adlercreutzia sp. R7]|uniref:LuxR C-terminal-related transcriptional regulator n=1 Tax=Adlercreutzia wanghongyangiae TaxID=3111451 RepID=A0ABU6IEV3_9ACTN|nr:LuxR C-terminal-related transcriptional regulator [Adlercreutzia sp. R7]